LTADYQPTPDSTVIIGCSNLIAENGHYLFVRESKQSARSRYNLPAGKPEPGETLTEAAVREAREETGLEVAVDHLIGLYHCPREGFGVVNLVFSSRPVGGRIRTSNEHPEVRYFSRAEIAGLAAERLIRGTHIERAIDDHVNGKRLPLSIVEIVPASPLPI
jgi:8-oxo-dGTP pyrophosphatase MutT (NUDIX family)